MVNLLVRNLINFFYSFYKKGEPAVKGIRTPDGYKTYQEPTIETDKEEVVIVEEKSEKEVQMESDPNGIFHVPVE